MSAKQARPTPAGRPSRESVAAEQVVPLSTLAAPRRAYGLSEEEMARPGATLLAMLFQEAATQGITLQKLAETVGVSYGYLSHLRTGLRQTTSISDEFAAACARFLRLPRASVLLAAGRLDPSDFCQEPDAIDLALDTAIAFIRRDAQHGPLMPLTVENMGRAEKYFVVHLYQAATGRRLIPTFETPEQLMASEPMRVAIERNRKARQPADPAQS